MKTPVLLTLLALFAVSATADAPGDAERGAELLAPFKSNLKQALVAGMQEGPATAIDVCRDKAPQIATWLSVDGVILLRSSHKLRNPGNKAPQGHAPVLHAWAKAEIHANDAEVDRPQSALVELPEGRRGYAEPIYMQPLCLTCHGADIAPDIAERIAALYPADAATGFSAGDFRGVFWVEFQP